MKPCKAHEKTKQKNEKARSIDDMYTENWESDHSCSVSKETTDVTVTRGMQWSDKV